MLPAVLSIAVSTAMVFVLALFLWVLLDLRRTHRDFHKATRDVLDNLIVRVCELEKEQEKWHGKS